MTDKACGQLECPFYAKGLEVGDRRPILKWTGLTIVGEIPGREEVRRGTPLVGAPGHMLKSVLEHLGTTVEAVHITHAIRCNFTGGVKPTDADMEKARVCCLDELEKSIDEAKPKAVISLGGIALLSTTGLKGVEKYRGATTEQTFGEHTCPVVSTIHPAAMMRNPKRQPWFDLFVSDFEKALHLASGREVIYRPVVEPFSVAVVKKILAVPSEPVGVDLETDGIDPRECGITTVGLSRMVVTDDGEEAPLTVSIPCPGLRAHFASKPWKEAWKLLREVFADPKRSWVFHNASFDVPIIERVLNVKVAGQVHDTLLAHHAIYSRTPHDLQAVASQFFCVEPWKAYYDKRFEGIKDEVIPELLYYNGADTAMTTQLHHIMWREMMRENLLPVYEVDRQISRYAMDWERIGLGIDEDVRIDLHYEFEADISALERNIRDMVGDDSFNPNSPKQLQVVLVDKFQLIPKKVTKSGQLSTDATALFDFRAHPFVELLQLYRTKTKLFSTYIDGLAKKVGKDGRMHPKWNKTATPSGRFGTVPAVQNWPRSMRKMLVPHKGRKIISSDFSALELRISVMLAGQEDLIESFLAGTDIHAQFAEVYFGEIWARASADQRKVLRTNAKPVTFGDIYRAGPQTLYENVREDVPGITFKEVQVMQARKREKYSRLNDYAEWVTQEANNTFELRTPWLGRRRRWPLGGVPDTEATNHPIQGGAADVVDAATIRWIERLKTKGDYHTRVWPVMQIHDDLRAEVSSDYAEQALQDLMDCMRCSRRIKSAVTGKVYEMKFEVEGKIGPNHLDLAKIPS